jgi:hypothetical protein
MPSRLHSLLVAGLLAPTDSFSAHPPATYGGATTHIATTLLRRRAAATPTCQFAEGGQFAEAIEAFAPRDTLLEVRAQRVKLQAELAAAVADEDFVTAAMLRDDLAELQQRTQRSWQSCCVQRWRSTCSASDLRRRRDAATT